MFSVLDTAVPMANRPRSGTDRACDQCKARKVRCDMTRPCVVCSKKGFVCTYENPRKRRGPTGKRIAEIRRLQSNPGEDRSPEDEMSYSGTPNAENEPPMEVQAPYSGGLDLQLMNTTSSNGTIDSYPLQYQSQQPYWPSRTPTQSGDIPFSSTYSDILRSPQQMPASATGFSENSAGLDNDVLVASPSQSEFLFPSLPIDSPSDSSLDIFGAIPHQDLPTLGATTDIWPSKINEETLLPWIDVYFKRLHPTIPILNRTNMYREMLTRKHHVDSQYGAMLLALSAFAMTQPVQIHERASTPSRSAQAQMLMEECVKTRVAADFGEDPSIEMILTSFFLFACLFGNNQHKAARLRLREAVDLAHSLGLHLPQSYDALDAEKKKQWLRTYLVLSVTERAYALQQRHSIDFRGRPGITARFMQAFDSTVATEYISHLIYKDQSDAVGMTGLLYCTYRLEYYMTLQHLLTISDPFSDGSSAA